MRIKAPLLAGGAGLCLLLLALAGPSGEPRGGVVLNPNPPEPPRWGLQWDLGALPKPATQAAGPLPFGVPCDAGQSARTDAGSGVEAALVEDPYAG